MLLFTYIWNMEIDMKMMKTWAKGKLRSIDFANGVMNSYENIKNINKGKEFDV